MQSGLLEYCRRSTAARVAIVCMTAWMTFGAPSLSAATFYVSAATGNDSRSTTTAQISSTPWKTITHALSQASSGDTIQVAPGLYDTPGNGETFPLTLENGVALLGNTSDPNTTVISAPQTSDVFFNTSGNLSASTRLAGFTLTNDAPGTANRRIRLDTASGDVQAPRIDHNRFPDDGDGDDFGIEIENSTSGPGTFTGTIENNDFGSIHYGVLGLLQVSGANVLSPAIQNNTFTGTDYPVSLTANSSAQGTVAPTVTGNKTTDTAKADVYMWVSSDQDGLSFSPTISGNTFSGLGGPYGATGVYLNVSGNTGPTDTMTVTPTITNNTFTDHSMGANVTFSRDIGSGTLNANVTVSNNTLTDVEGGIDFVQSLVANGNSINANETININANRFMGGTGGAIYTTLARIEPARKFDGTFNIKGNWIQKDTSYLFDAIQINMSDGAPIAGDPNDAIHVNVVGNMIEPNDPTNLAFRNGIYMHINDPNDLGTFDTTIQGNTVTSINGPGSFRLSFSSAQSVGNEKIDISDNYVNKGHTSGAQILWFEPTGTAPNPILLRCNTFTNNDIYGIAMYGYAGEEPNFGDPNDPGHNSFYGNDIYDTPPYQFYSEESNPTAAQGNWWGTNDPNTISAQIYDPNGPVDFANYLTSAPTTVVTSDMTLTNVNDIAPPGNSPGDTLRVTVTLNASGTCTGAYDHYTGPIPANTTYVQGSLTTTSGYKVEPLPGSGGPIYVQGIEIPPGGSATITYDVIANAANTDVTTDGTLQSGNTGTQAVGPASVTIASAALIPTLGQWGLIFLTLLLAMTALWILRRRKGAVTIIVIALCVIALPLFGAERMQRVRPAPDIRAATVSTVRADGRLIDIRLSDGSEVSVRPELLRVRIPRERGRKMTVDQRHAIFEKRQRIRGGDVGVIREALQGRAVISTVTSIQGHPEKRAVIEVFPSLDAARTELSRREATARKKNRARS